MHSVKGIKVEECCKFFADFLNVPPMSDAAFVSKMHIFSREICEGFFAEKIILVEGVSDKAVLEGCYLASGRNPLEEGICIVPVDGKTKTDKPLYIFDRLAIPVFAVFDSDIESRDQNPRANRVLQHVCGASEIVDFPEGCHRNYFAFLKNLEKYLKSVVGETFSDEFERISSEYNLSVNDLLKTPHAISKVVASCRIRGAQFDDLDRIIQTVDDL